MTNLPQPGDTPVFTTPRLVVRPWRRADLGRLFDIYSRWEVARWLGAQPAVLTSPEAAGEMLARWASYADAAGRYGIWAIWRPDHGASASAGTGIGTGGEVEVGWHLHPDSWGHGYATEAARGALAKGFADGLDEIYAVVRPDNEASLAVCARLGMTPLGLTRRWYGLELAAFRADRHWECSER